MSDDQEMRESTDDGHLGQSESNDSSPVTFKKPKLLDFNGIWYPSFYYTFEKYVETKFYEPTSDDIFVVTYPKSGTTWMQYILWEILYNNLNSSRQPSVHEMWFEKSLQIELYGVKKILQMDVPRIIKSHNPLDHFCYTNKSGKFIYVYRNPWDVCISYYNNIRDQPKFFGFEDGTLNDAIECFLTGYLPWGDYFTHVKSWLSRRYEENVLIISYEEIKIDPKEEILKISKFVSDPDVLKHDASRLEDILTRISFENMKNLEFLVPKKIENDGWNSRLNSNASKSNDEYKNQPFFKMGKINYGFNLFNSDQKKRMIMRIRNELGPEYPDLLDKWKELGIPV